MLHFCWKFGAFGFSVSKYNEHSAFTKIFFVPFSFSGHTKQSKRTSHENYTQSTGSTETDYLKIVFVFYLPQFLPFRASSKVCELGCVSVYITAVVVVVIFTEISKKYLYRKIACRTQFRQASNSK